jgi:hypothetical protein
MNMEENFSWLIEHIKYATINVGSENFIKVDLPEYVKSKINNDTLSRSFIIWRLEKESLFGIKYANKEIAIKLKCNDKFLYLQFSEKGNINSGSIFLINKDEDKKLLVSGDIELLSKLYSVLRIWFGDKLEYISSDNYVFDNDDILKNSKQK